MPLCQVLLALLLIEYVMALTTDDTIAAIATPPGSGGIAIIRISGEGAIPVLKKVFSPLQKQTAMASAFVLQPRYMHYGHALDSEGETLDEVLAVVMPGPHSFTGEDVAEIHCHGSSVIAGALLEAIFASGARAAFAGEFTKRAFLNGRIDLTQAEAVAEAIAAPTREGVRLAQAKLEGALGGAVAALRASLDTLRVQMTVAVDFPDEELEILPKAQLLQAILEARGHLAGLLAGFERAKLWREGALVALVGQVNAGKSSLLNALLGRQRAIVSDVPGTTRDYIEENINIHGLAIRLVDTAGLRKAGDIVEEEGIRRSFDLAGAADLLLLVIDAGKGITEAERGFLAQHETRPVLVVLNKADTVSDAECSLLCQTVPQACLLVSSKTGVGLEALGSAIYTALAGSDVALAHGDIAPNARQRQLLSVAAVELVFLEQDAHAGLPPDILAVRVDTATAMLDEVTGTTTDEAILDQVFSSFCIGK